METHYEGVIPTEIVQADGSANVVDLHVNVASTQLRVSRVEDSPLDELLTESSFESVGGLNKPVLRLRLTNERDLYFLYTLDVDDRVFRVIKQRNQLRVDFGMFHQSLTDLIERCVAEATSPTPSFRCQLSIGNRSRDTVGVLSFLEMTSFRQVNVLTLELTRGNDEEVKRHLSSELSHYKTLSSDLSQQLRFLQTKVTNDSASSDETISSLRDELSLLRETRERELADLKLRLSSELLTTKQTHAEQVQSIRETKDQERDRALSSLRETEQRTLSQLQDLTSENLILSDVKAQLTSQLSLAKTQLEGTRSLQSDTQRSLDEVRERNRELEIERVEQEKNLKAQSVELAALKQQVEDKQEQIDQCNRLVTSLREQNESHSEASGIYRKRVSTSQKKIERCYAEIRKGSTIVRHLQKKLQRQKRRFIEMERNWKETDTLLKARNSALERLKLENDSIKQQLEHSFHEVKIKDRELEESNLERERVMKEKINMKEMINHLSSQLNDLQSSSVLATGLSSLSQFRRNSSSPARMASSSSAMPKASSSSTTDFSSRYPGLGIGVGVGGMGGMGMGPSREGGTATSAGLSGFAYSGSNGTNPLASELFGDPMRSFGVGFGRRGGGGGSGATRDLSEEDDMVATEDDLERSMGMAVGGGGGGGDDQVVFRTGKKVMH